MVSESYLAINHKSIDSFSHAQRWIHACIQDTEHGEQDHWETQMMIMMSWSHISCRWETSYTTWPPLWPALLSGLRRSGSLLLWLLQSFLWSPLLVVSTRHVLQNTLPEPSNNTGRQGALLNRSLVLLSISKSWIHFIEYQLSKLVWLYITYGLWIWLHKFCSLHAFK